LLEESEMDHSYFSWHRNRMRGCRERIDAMRLNK